MNLNKTIIWLVSILNKWHLSRIEKYDLEIPNNKDNYEALIPNTQDDNKQTYYSGPFGVALRTPNVNNIAITGSYGSGKSSFLRKFEKENAEWNYLPVSLASFKDANNDNGENDSNKVSEGSSILHQDIERSILQQFFYREKDKTIPFSRFKKIKKVSKIDIFLLAISIPYLYLYFIRPVAVKNILPEIVTNFTYEHNYIFLGLAIVLFLTGFYRLLYYLGSFQISKFDIKKNTITIARQDEASILNEHLDEILYFFEATNYDVVIFEDIDRFENTEIFVKLRELNNIVNSSKQINRKIVFVYAIRDDMFVDKERTKFFDFIVPIIPYINPSNSEQKLIEKFRSEINSKSLNEHFLSQLSWYIDDMRLLINIYNEYMIYKNNLNSDKLDHNKLLALIVCKNFYPSDFAKLHVREGEIYQLFSKKPEYIKGAIDNLNKEKKEKAEELNKLLIETEKEILKNVRELKLSILAGVFEKTNAEKLTVGKYTQRSIYELMSVEDLFENINNKVTVIGYVSSGYQLRESGRVEFTNTYYLRRKEIIETKYDTKIDVLKVEIEKIGKKIDKLKNASLEELFETSSELIVVENHKDKDLLIFLVRNGYIDEHYEHYISYFHEGSITQEDREFLLSIQNHKPLNFTAALGNISKLIEKLEEKDFDSEYILNNQLTSYLLKSSNTTKREKYFKQISNGKDKSIEFVFQYVEYATDEEKKLFIKQLTWDGLWSYIYKELSIKEQNKYFKLLFNGLEVERLVELDISSYLSKQTVLPKYTEEDNKKCQELISKLNIEFEYIKNPSKNPPLFTYIYENEHYAFNPKIVELIVKEKGNVESSKIDELQYKNLTIIRGSEAQNLIKNIDNNINLYFENIFNQLDENKQEAEDTLLYFLNHDELNIEYKESIIEQVETKVSDITSVEEKELWETFFVENKIKATWDNLLSYYQNLEEQKIDDVLIDYLNKEDNYKQLAKSKINNEEVFDKDEILQPFNRKLILSSSLSDEAYSYLIKSIWFVNYKNLSLNKLSISKIDSILSTKILSLTQDNITALKESFSPKHIALIENKKNELLEDFSNFELDSDDMLKILNSTKFTTEEKFQVLKNIDLVFFDNSKALKEKVSKLYIDNSKEIEAIDLFDKLFYGENKYDLELLISQIDYFEECDSIKSYLDALDRYDESYNELLDKNRNKLYLEDTAQNRLLLEKLKSKDCISSWRENKKTLGKNNLKVERKRV